MGNGTAWPRWVDRFDKLILVAAPDEVKVARFVGRAISAIADGHARRSTFERDAKARLALQIPDQEKAARWTT